MCASPVTRNSSTRSAAGSSETGGSRARTADHGGEHHQNEGEHKHRFETMDLVRIGFVLLAATGQF